MDSIRYYLLGGVLASFSLIGCDSGQVTNIGRDDGKAPQLSVQSPLRASLLNSNRVLVEGVVTDDSGIRSLLVGNQTVSIDANGHFSVMVDVEPGIALIEIVAVDNSGAQSREERAVLSGERVSNEQAMDDALVLYAGEGAFHMFETTLKDMIGNLDLTALAMAQNPIMSEESKCGTDEVRIKSLQVSSTDVELTPQNGTVSVKVRMHDVRAVFDVAYSTSLLLCVNFGDEAVLDIKTLVLSADAVFDLKNEKIQFHLDSVQSNFENFKLELNGLAGKFVELFRKDISQDVAGMLTSSVEEIGQTMIAPYLEDLNRQEWGMDVLGMETIAHFSPTRLLLNSQGMRVESKIRLGFPGIDLPEFVATSGAAPKTADLESSDDLRIGISDDIVNLILAALWSQKKINKTFSIPKDNILNSLFSYETVEITMKLPPMIKSHQEASVASIFIGDAFIRILDSDGQVLERLSLSAKVGLVILSKEGSLIRLSSEDSELWIASLTESGDTARNPAIPRYLKSFLMEEISNLLEDTLGPLSAPLFDELNLVPSSLGVATGYLLLGGKLEAISPQP